MMRSQNPSNAKLTPEDYAYSILLSYVGYQFPGYKIGRHHALIAKYLEAVEAGKINRLMIFAPPRHGKSMLVSEFFPAWYLGRNPSHQIIATTYSHDRAGDTGRKVRDQLLDPTYQIIFPGCQIAPDSKSANKLSTMAGGNMFSVGVCSAITGRGAHVFLIDDPIKDQQESESEVSQRKLRDWFEAVAYTRLMGNGAIILVMTRWNYYDLAGYLLREKKHENWTVLNLPAIAESTGDQLGRGPGESLWPTHYPRKQLDQIKRTVGTRKWNALYQQNPIPEEGGMIKPEWFQRYSNDEYTGFLAAIRLGMPIEKTKFPFKQLVFSWDTAYKESKMNDPSACTVWGITENAYYLVYAFARHLEFPDLRYRILKLHESTVKRIGVSPAQAPILIEDAASGQSMIQDLKRTTRLPVIGIKPDKNKKVRFAEVTPLIEAGKVFLPERAVWLVDYETQLSQFPYAQHDDLVDSTSQFLRWANKPRFKRSNVRFWK